jgi:hypothetical protein
VNRDRVDRTILALVLLAGCRPPAAPSGGQARELADAVHAVLSADREVYTQEVVQRLQNEEHVIKASEHWKDDKLLPLPAQMLRMGAARAREKSKRFSYALLSLWPINKQNAPHTDVEKAGLQAVVDAPGEPHYAEESLGGAGYFTAVYADRAVSAACAACHNGHRESPRHDFKQGDVMGGVVVRVKE